MHLVYTIIQSDGRPAQRPGPPPLAVTSSLVSSKEIVTAACRPTPATRQMSVPLTGRSERGLERYPDCFAEPMPCPTRIGNGHTPGNQLLHHHLAWERAGVSMYGRQDDEWDALVRAGRQFLRERAMLKRDTSYTEMSTALARRTGYPPFDFAEQAERTAMGYLLGRIVQETYQTVGAMMSALVIYLDSNDAGTGFYQLAQDMGLLPRGASKDVRDAFWVQQVNKTFDYFRAGGRLKLD